MTTQVVTHLEAMERGPLRVVSSLRGRGDDAGVCIELYGRSPRNAWFEAVRVDGYLGNVHYHGYSEEGVVIERAISTTTGRDDIVQAVVEFVRTEARTLLTDLGFAPAAADDTIWGEVVAFLRTGVLTAFHDLSGESAGS